MMKVIAAPGLKVPKEDRGQIDEATAIEVPNSSYYRRRIADGDLQRVTESDKKTTKKGAE